MAGNFAGGSPASAPENQWISRLKDLEVSQIAEVFDGFCFECHALLKSRLLSLNRQKHVDASSKVDLSSPPANINQQQHSNHERTPSKESAYSSSNYKSSPSPANGKPQVRDLFGPNLSSTVGNHGPSTTVSNGNSEGEEWHRFSQVVRKKNFVHYERHNGKETNVIQGLELHTGVFSTQEQKKIVESVYNFQKMGQKGQLLARTYSEPRKWMRGKGRVTIQFGCCYNYAVDKDGNPPGIVRDEEVDPLPPIFKNMIKRMVRWHVLPPTCVPDSCIVNIYDEGDCIPPHIDHHDFLRPFCTVSFLAECNILFGLNLKVSGPGEFSGPISIPLPVGSVLVLKGNGADVAKHCVPAVPARRISVTFRRMDDSKIPYSFLSDPDLLNLRPLFRPSGGIKAGVAAQEHQQPEAKNNGKTHKLNSRQPADNSFILQKNEFPPLGSLKL